MKCFLCNKLPSGQLKGNYGEYYFLCDTHLKKFRNFPDGVELFISEELKRKDGLR